jgi:hypothetical protein
MSDLLELFAALRRIPGAVGRSLADRKHRRWMRKAPTFLIRDMPENTFAKIVGHARPFRGRALEAPLSKRKCVYYDISIDLMTDANSYLRTIATYQDGLPFVLQDNTGAAIIDPAHAFVSSGIDATATSNGHDVTDTQKALLQRASVGVAIDDSLRYREAVLEIDEMVAIFGGGIREPDPDGVGAMTYRDSAPTRLHLTGTAKFPLFISDDPRTF